MEQQSINRFVKGIVSDMNPIDIDNQSWVFPTTNVRITKVGDMIVAKPLDGNKELFVFPYDVKVIGAAEYADILYFVLYRKDTGHIEIGSYPHVLKNGNEFIYEYGPLKFVEYTDPGIGGGGLPIGGDHLFGQKLGFNDKHKVDLKFYSSYDDTTNIYLNDGINPTYIINNCFSSEGKYIDRSVAYNTLPKSVLLINNSSNPVIFNQCEVKEGGELPPGNYQFFVRYVTESYDKTLFISQSDFISVASGYGNLRYGKFKTKNGHQSKTINKINLSLSNLDINYKYFQIGVVVFSGDQNDEIRFDTYLINRYFSTELDNQISITGFESKADLSVDELVLITTSDSLCRAHEIYNGRYIGANWQNSVDDDDLVSLGQKIKAKGVEKDIDNTNMYDAAFMNREIYPFGVVFVYDKNGKESDVYPIRASKYDGEDGLVIIDSGNNPGYNKHYGVNIDISQIKSHLADRDDITGFYIVRSNRIKNQIAGGVVVPMADGINLGVNRYFYNKSAGADSGYAIPNTFFNDYYPTIDAWGENKAGFGSARFLVSSETKRKLALFSPEVLFHEQSNVDNLDGDQLYLEIDNSSEFSLVDDGNKNVMPYKGIEQTSGDFPIGDNKYPSQAYFVRKGTKTNNGNFSAYIPDSFKDDPAVKSNNYGGSNYLGLRSSLFNNYIGLKSDSDTATGISIDGPAIIAYTFGAGNGWDFTDPNWINQDDLAKCIDGVSSEDNQEVISPTVVNISSPDPGEATREALFVIKIKVQDYVSGLLNINIDKSYEAVDVVYNIPNDEENIGSIDGDGEYLVVVSLKTTEVELAEDEPIFSVIESLIKIRLTSSGFTGNISEVSIFNMVNQQDSSSIYFNFKAKMLRLYRFPTELSYVESVRENFDIRNTFYQKVSQFISKDVFYDDFDIYSGDVYTGDFYMRGHKWFDAKQLYALGGSGLDRIYQHGSYLKFRVKTDINIFARSLQPVVMEDGGQGNYSFLPYEMSRENDWVVKSSLERDMHESTLLNRGFSQNESIKKYIGYDNLSPNRKSEYKTRLRASDKAEPGSFYNSFKVFRANEYQDYDEQYGPIIAIFNLKGQLLAVQHNAINVIYTKESSSEEFDIALGSTNKYFYERPYLKASFGARDKSHLIQTNEFIYGVDIANLKIYRIATGSSPEGKQLVQVDDLTEKRLNSKYLTEFLDSIKENIIDLNIGYDEKNKEVLFTFIHQNAVVNDEDNSIDERTPNESVSSKYYTTIVFTEKNNSFSGLYIMPSEFYSTFKNKMISIKENKAYIHDDTGDQLNIYGTDYSMVLSYIINNAGKEASPYVEKYFEALKLRTPNIQFEKIIFRTESQKAELDPFFDDERFWLQPDYKEYKWEIPVPLNMEEDEIFGIESKMRGEWMKVTLHYKGKEEFYITHAIALFNPTNL